MRFRRECQARLTFQRQQPPKEEASERREAGEGGGQEIRGEEVERKSEVRVKKMVRRGQWRKRDKEELLRMREKREKCGQREREREKWLGNKMKR